MSSEQPSLFDQLTPSDSLRDDLAWIDSLQEDTQEDDKPARQERKPRKRRGRKNIPTEHEPEQPTPPPPPASHASITPRASAIAASLGANASLAPATWPG